MNTNSQKIYVIETETFVDCDESNNKPIFVNEILSYLGYWTDETSARLKCTELNARDCDENQDDIYYVSELKRNG